MTNIHHPLYHNKALTHTPLPLTPSSIGGELPKREGVLVPSLQSEAGSFCCFFHRFTKIYALITISLLDIGFKWCFVISFFCFERVHLAMRGCTCALRGCSRTIKTPNSPPLPSSPPLPPPPPPPLTLESTAAAVISPSLGTSRPRRTPPSSRRRRRRRRRTAAVGTRSV